MSEVKAVRLTDILKCPELIILPDHYREDGSCYCDERQDMADVAGA